MIRTTVQGAHVYMDKHLWLTQHQITFTFKNMWCESSFRWTQFSEVLLGVRQTGKWLKSVSFMGSALKRGRTGEEAETFPPPHQPVTPPPGSHLLLHLQSSRYKSSSAAWPPFQFVCAWNPDFPGWLLVLTPFVFDLLLSLLYWTKRSFCPLWVFPVAGVEILTQ